MANLKEKTNSKMVTTALYPKIQQMHCKQNQEDTLQQFFMSFDNVVESN